MMKEKFENDLPQNLFLIDENEYQVCGRITEGGTSECFLLLRSNPASLAPGKFLLKRLKPCFANHPVLVEALKREFTIGQELKHCEHIASYVAYFPEQEAVAMKMVNGATLSEFLETESGKSYFGDKEEGFGNMVRFSRQVLSALGAMHARRIYHCDLTSHNIMIREVTNDAVVIDLGMAKTDGDFNLIGRTNSACAPEMNRGQADNRSDIYMFGRLLGAINKWSGNLFIATMADRCLQDAPEDRYQSVEEMLESIGKAYSDAVSQRFVKHFYSSSGQDNFSIADSAVYLNDKRLAEVSELAFFRHNPMYLQLLEERDTLLAEAEMLCRHLQGGEALDDKRINQLLLKYKEQLYWKDKEISEYERSFLDTLHQLQAGRTEMEEEEHNELFELFNQGRLDELKKKLSPDVLKSGIEEHLKGLKDAQKLLKRDLSKMLLSVDVTLLEREDPDRFTKVVSQLETMLGYCNYLPEEQRESYYLRYGNYLVNYRFPFELAKESVDRVKTFIKDPIVMWNIELEMSTLCRKRGDYESALVLAQRVKQEFEKYVGENFLMTYNRIYYTLGKIYYQLKQFDDALKVVNEWRDGAKLPSEMCSNDIVSMCDMLFFAGEVAEAREDMPKAIKCYKSFAFIAENYLSPNDKKVNDSIVGNAYSKMGMAYIKNSQSEEGRTALKKAVELKSQADFTDFYERIEYADTLVAYALACLDRRGKINASTQLLAQAFEQLALVEAIDPDHPHYKTVLERACYLKGVVEEYAN